MNDQQFGDGIAKVLSTFLHALFSFHTWWFIIKSLWPLLLLLLMLFMIRILIFRLFDKLDLEIYNWRVRKRFNKSESWRNDRDFLHWLRGMKPVEFEDYIADLYRRLGFKAEQVGGSCDGGVDVIAEKDGISYYIQCKKFITRKVGVHDIRDFYGALADKLTHAKGYFITTNIFTLEAEKFAEDKPLELIDGRKLMEYVRLAGKPEPISKENKLCPLCGNCLVERSGKFGKFYGCSNYPKCNYTKNS